MKLARCGLGLQKSQIERRGHSRRYRILISNYSYRKSFLTI
jgi:hypothetical protein